MSKSYIGKVIDNYRILESIGIGGMGVVFKAINTRLDKLVALKMIAPGLAMNEDFIKRFQKEAKALAKLADPNIVSIYDLRQENDQWYIVMEYIDGPSLSDLIQRKKGLSIRDSLSVIKQLLRAVGHAHQANIIHRDIKPNNIMINSEKVVKITDFGLSKDQNAARNTMTVQSGGTLYYMSPEHVRGFSFTDKRSDIYSIGMTLYEMLTGKVPFENMETDFDIRESIIRKNFIKPTHYNPKIPRPLEAIVMKSIAKNPDERYQSAKEMLEDIQRFEASLKGSDVISKPSTRSKKQKSAKPKNKFIIYSAAATIIILTILIILATGTWEKEDDAIQNGMAEENVTGKKKTTDTSPGSIVKADTIDTLQEAEKQSGSVQKEKVPPAARNSTTVSTTTTVFISSNPPGAKIYINGIYKGETPNTVFGIKSGQNQIMLKADGYEELYEDFLVRRGQKLTINRKLDALTGAVVLSYQPTDATVKVDGTIINSRSNPLNLSDLSAGKHTIEVARRGYSVYNNTIEIKQGIKTQLDITLTELKGRLSVLVKPWGSIYIDNQMQKANTDIKFEKELPQKEYVLKIAHPTFGEWKKEISIKHNTEENIVVDFNRTVTVQVNALDTNNQPVSAKIIVDNKPTNYITPENIQLRPGIHTFLVEKEGFIATEDRKEFLVDNSFRQPIIFVLKKIE